MTLIRLAILLKVLALLVVPLLSLLLLPILIVQACDFLMSCSCPTSTVAVRVFVSGLGEVVTHSPATGELGRPSAAASVVASGVVHKAVGERARSHVSPRGG